MSVNIGTLKTRRGANLVFHFENESIKKLFEGNVDLRQLQKDLQNAISAMDADTGKGTKVHLLLNREHSIRVLAEKDFTEWEKNPEKDWHHDRTEFLIKKRMFADLVDSLDQQLLDDFIDDLIKTQEGNKYTGPAKKQFVKYMDDPRSEIVARKATKDHNCVICIAPTGVCPVRQKSFDKKLFKAALEK